VVLKQSQSFSCWHGELVCLRFTAS
jgi:hypothetical protein